MQLITFVLFRIKRTWNFGITEVYSLQSYKMIQIGEGGVLAKNIPHIDR